MDTDGTDGGRGEASAGEEEREWRNPFKNEGDAFRILVMFMIAAGLVVAAAELVGSWAGLVVGAVAALIGLWAAANWLRVGLGENEEDEDER